MTYYLSLVKPELLIALGILLVGFICLGVYAIHVDKKREHGKNRSAHN